LCPRRAVADNNGIAQLIVSGKADFVVCLGLMKLKVEISVQPQEISASFIFLMNFWLSVSLPTATPLKILFGILW
jgi:hypothetical protein